ncbi:MAG: hypothetical protein M3N98_01035, partial [Actinomycetota bacterium]|nr:hypothetical protein [Actinomycetota bacterium]
RSCEGRALAAPAFDDGEIVRFGDLGKRGEIAQRWSQLGFKPGDLNDCVVIHTGGFGYLRLLMYIPRASFEAGLVVRSVAGSGGAGAVVDQRSVGVGDMVTAAQLPPRWVDASGPWFADVDLVIRALPNLMPIAGVMVLVTVKGAGQADRVEVGLTRPKDKVNSSDQLGQRPYFVAVIESLLGGEVARSDYDSTTATRTHSVLEKALGPDSTSHALLAPDTTYQVKTGWKVSRAKRDASGSVVADTTLQGKDATASFWFHTDHAAPQRLDPWLLTTTPAEAEQHVFCADPLQIVFSTDDVASLYDAYGLRLQVRLKAASLRHPDPAGGVPHPFPIDGTTLQKVPAAVLSPWEQTVGSVVDASCVAVDGNRTRHTQVTIPIPLDPLTDYVLDIEAVAKAAPAGATGGRVLRRSFSTSRYAGVGDFAAAFTGTRLNHRGTRPGVLQAVGATFAGQPPQGHELDAALIAAGLEPLPVPSSPKVTLFWEQANPTDVPAPAAVLIDAPEPLWRRRPLPTDVSDPPPSTARRFELHAQEWLGLIEDAASGGLVDHIVPAPGGQRALVTLKPGSRGRRLVLSLQTTSYPKPVFEPAGAIHASTILVDVAMVHAPWEEL